MGYRMIVSDKMFFCNFIQFPKERGGKSESIVNEKKVSFVYH